MTSNGSIRVAATHPAKACPIPADQTDREVVTKSIEKNVNHHCTFIQRAADDDVEIICFPEDVCGLAPMAALGKDGAFFRSIVKETADGALEAFRLEARQCGIYVIATTACAEGEAIYNTAVLIGPDGKEIGRYRKTHLAPGVSGEDKFITAGTDYPVFETQIGRIGIVICWDLMFPETTRILALNGAEMIFCPTLGFDFGGEHIGEARVRTRAFDNALYLIVSMYGSARREGPGRSCIVGPQGHIIADAGYRPDVIITADIAPADRSPNCTDPDRTTGLDMWGLWCKCRRPQTYGRITETSPNQV